LYAARAQAAADLVPEERADLVADEPVEHAPTLLRVAQLHVDLARVVEGITNGVGRNLVELDALVAAGVQIHSLEEVPGDGLALAVGVSGEVDELGTLRRLLELLDDVLLVLGHDIARSEVVIDIDAELRLREVADVA